MVSEWIKKLNSVNMYNEEDKYRDEKNNNLVTLPNGVIRYRDKGRGVYDKLQHLAIDKLLCTINSNVVNNIDGTLFKYIGLFKYHKDVNYLIYGVISVIHEYYKYSNKLIKDSVYEAIDRVSKRCEYGARKYTNADNWRAGMPTDWLIDSALRHYMKYKCGDNDEDHYSAILWNLLSCIEIILEKKENEVWINGYYKTNNE